MYNTRENAITTINKDKLRLPICNWFNLLKCEDSPKIKHTISTFYQLRDKTKSVQGVSKMAF